ncbi:MAG: hypothetical protein QOE71_633 [Pseudonocardiales bacterium]|nr:hypothetical protein [Pseudonocardiales bacterium]
MAAKATSRRGGKNVQRQWRPAAGRGVVPEELTKRASAKVRAPRGGGDLIVQKFNGPGDAPSTTTVSAGRGPSSTA